jgi:putative transposase
MLVAERLFIYLFIYELSTTTYGNKQSAVSTDGGGTWYHPQACKFLKLEHHLHSTLKSIIERTIQYIKDRTECFDDYYFPCRKNKCRLEEHVMRWMNLFIDMHNEMIPQRRVK